MRSRVCFGGCITLAGAFEEERKPFPAISLFASVWRTLFFFLEYGNVLLHNILPSSTPSFLSGHVQLMIKSCLFLQIYIMDKFFFPSAFRIRFFLRPVFQLYAEQGDHLLESVFCYKVAREGWQIDQVFPYKTLLTNVAHKTAPSVIIYRFFHLAESANSSTLSARRALR